MKVIAVYMQYGQVFVGKQKETVGKEIVLKEPLMLFINKILNEF